MMVSDPAHNNKTCQNRGNSGGTCGAGGGSQWWVSAVAARRRLRPLLCCRTHFYVTVPWQEQQ